jgi:hypothetical protein
MRWSGSPTHQTAPAPLPRGGAGQFEKQAPLAGPPPPGKAATPNRAGTHGHRGAAANPARLAATIEFHRAPQRNPLVKLNASAAG